MWDIFNTEGYGWMLWDGALMTISVGLLAMLVAVLLGLVGAWGRLSRSPFVRGLAALYTTVVRGVPELVMIMLVYYGIPTFIQNMLSLSGMDVVFDLNPFRAGVLTIGFIYGAFTTEVFRGAFLAVDKGQIEAARAIGMSKPLAFRRVVLPQMMRIALPGLGNVWMVLIKATALISLIQLSELMFMANTAYMNTRKPFTFFFLASLIYLGITVLSMVGQHYAERWTNRGVRRAR